MNFDFSKLLGRIKEFGFTQKSLAKVIGISSSTLSAKLNNKNAFTVTEIACICRVLDVSKLEVGKYFFTEKVQEN